MTAAVEKPSWVPMFVLGRLPAARSVYRRLSTSPWKIGDGATLFPGVDIRAVRDRLFRDGVSPGVWLPDSVVGDIRAFSLVAPCFGNSDQSDRMFVGLDEPVARRDGLVIADYRDGIRACPAIRRLWDDPTLTGIAAAYLGRKPHLLRSRLWWSFVPSGVSDAERAGFSQEFHFDLDDWLCCKFFFYITDTGEDAGPHQYVRESHRRRPLSLQLSAFKSCSEGKIRNFYASEAIITLIGSRGFGFVEDPFGIHRGVTPTGRARLILEVEYGCSAQPVAGRYGALGT